MWGNKLLLLLLGRKTLSFETIAEVSFKKPKVWDDCFLTEIIIQLNSHICI